MPPSEPARWCADARFVRTLARHLVADANLADDITQEAWLRTLGGQGPRDGFRGWVGRVVRNLVTSHHRSEQRRVRHEPNATPPAPVAPEPPVAAAGLEAQALLLAAVRTLDEPYRTAIVLRYFEGSSPRAIAARLRLPVRTVHTHLQRAMAQLRARLGERDPRWATLLLPLLPASASSPTLSVVMVRALLLLLGVGAMAFTMWVFWPAVAAPPPAPAVASLAASGAAEARAVAMESNQRRAVAAPASTAPEARAASQPVAPATEPWPLGGLALDIDGAPVPRVRVVLRDFGSNVLMQATTDERGSFEMTLPDVSGGEIDIDDPDWTGVLRPVLWGNRDVGELTLVAARAAPVTGIVVDGLGQPIAGAEVAIAGVVPPRAQFARNLERARNAEWRTSSDADGHFAVARAPLLPGMRISAARTGYRSQHEDLTARVAVRLVLARGEVLVGRVVDANGNPVAAAVFCHPAGASCGADGRFELDIGNASSPWLCAAQSGHLPARLHSLAEPPNLASSWPPAIELRLGGPPLTMRGRVLRADGSPLPDPHVQLLDTECLVEGNGMSSIEFLARVHSQVTEHGASFWEDRTIPDPQLGTFELGGLQDRSYRIEYGDREALQRAISEPLRAGSQEIVLRLPPEPRWPAVAGVVVDRRGQPVAGVDVWAERVLAAGEEPLSTRHRTTAADGRFALAALAQSGSTLRAQAPGTAKAVAFDLRTSADVAALRLVVPVKTTVRVQAPGADSVRFLDREGHVVFMTVTQGDVAWGAEAVALTNGSSETVTVPDDAVTMVLQQGGVEVARVPVDLRPGDLQVLRL